MKTRSTVTLSVLLGVMLSGLAPVTASASDLRAADLPSLLIVQEADSVHAYLRENFRHWTDADSDGCDTRQEVLIQESQTPVTIGVGCSVGDGSWLSLYDGAVWTLGSDVDIDHTVPLAEAWRSGAWSWSPMQRESFANDLDADFTLIAVTDSVNRSKGDRDPAQWMPPATTYSCQYAIDWALVKYRWRLTVDPSEQGVLRSVLSGECGSLAVPLPAQMDVPIPTTGEEPAPGDGDISNDVPGDAQQSSDFSDVSPASSTYKTITWLASTGITYGYSDGTFRPLNPVTRGAMSAFLYRFHSSPSYTPLMRSPFRDVPTDDSFYKTISWLSSSGITAGYSDGTYRKSNPVTRGSMAAFLYRTAGSPAYTQPSISPFSDVKTTDTFYKVISWLASTGITVGYADGEYKQSRPVTRSAMAAFLYRFNNVESVPLFSPPGNPGDTRNCGDFTTWSAAQSWYEDFYPYYGDIARLDGNNDGVVCTSLPGAP